MEQTRDFSPYNLLTVFISIEVLRWQ